MKVISTIGNSAKTKETWKVVGWGTVASDAVGIMSIVHKASPVCDGRRYCGPVRRSIGREYRL